MCLDGFLECDKDFAFEFIYTTEQWIPKLLTLAHKYIDNKK